MQVLFTKIAIYQEMLTFEWTMKEMQTDYRRDFHMLLSVDAVLQLRQFLHCIRQLVDKGVVCVGNAGVSLEQLERSLAALQPFLKN